MMHGQPSIKTIVSVSVNVSVVVYLKVQPTRCKVFSIYLFL